MADSTAGCARRAARNSAAPQPIRPRIRTPRRPSSVQFSMPTIVQSYMPANIKTLDQGFQSVSDPPKLCVIRHQFHGTCAQNNTVFKPSLRYWRSALLARPVAAERRRVAVRQPLDVAGRCTLPDEGPVLNF